MRLATCFYGIRGSIRASCSIPPSRTILMALSIANSSVPKGTPTTFVPRYCAMSTPTPAKSDISPGVGTCPPEAKATVLLGLRCVPLPVNSRSRKDLSLIHI